MSGKSASSVYIAFEVIIPLLILACLIGNFFVCAIIILGKKMRTSFNYLLLNLAFSDLVCSLVGTLIYAEVIRNHYFRSSSSPHSESDRIICRIAVLGTDISTRNSIFTLAAISTDRFYAVVRPLRHRRTMAKRNIWILIGVMWFLACVSAIPLALILAKAPAATRQENTVVICLNSLTRDDFYEVASFVDLIVSYVIPMAIILRTSFSVIRHLWSSKSTPQSGTNQALLKSRKRVTRIAFSVIITFNVFWLPWAVAQGLLLMGTQQPFDSVTFVVLFSLVLASACVNPLLYSLQSRKFRQQVNRIVRCGK